MRMFLSVKNNLHIELRSEIKKHHLLCFSYGRNYSYNPPKYCNTLLGPSLGRNQARAFRTGP
jgi:hypothetical protein